MGLRLDIYRSASYDSTLNVFHGRAALTIVNADGPSDPTDDAPAAMIAPNALGNPVIVPVDAPSGVVGPMFGGTYGGTSDSRLRDAMRAATGVAIYGALPIHDRFESWELYNAMSD